MTRAHARNTTRRCLSATRLRIAPKRRAARIIPTASLRLHCEGAGDICPDGATVRVHIGNAAKDGLSAQVLDRSLRSAGWALAVSGTPPSVLLDPVCPTCARALHERTSLTNLEP